MKTIAFFFAALIAGMLYFNHALQSGKVLKFIDEHPKSSGIPEATYYIGQGYYIFQNLPDATTYFLRVAQRYPDHSLGDDSYFAYLQCLDDARAVSRIKLAEGYEAYLEKYPEGKHKVLAKNRIGLYRTGGG